MELNTALRETIRKNGKSVLADANMLKAHLADLAPDQSRTISVLCQASAAHIFDRLAVCEESETESELRMALLQLYETYAPAIVDQIKAVLCDVMNVDLHEAETKPSVPKTKEPAAVRTDPQVSASSETKKSGGHISKSETTFTDTAVQKTDSNADVSTGNYSAAGLLIGVLAATVVYGIIDGTFFNEHFTYYMFRILELLLIIMIFSKKDKLTAWIYLAMMVLNMLIRGFGKVAILEMIINLLSVLGGVFLVMLAYGKTDRHHLPAAIQLTAAVLHAASLLVSGLPFTLVFEICFYEFIYAWFLHLYSGYLHAVYC